MANLNGKKGSQKHQDVQKAEKKKVTEEFSEQTNVVVETEVPVATPNGKKKHRVADIAAFSNDAPFQFFKFVQIGKTDKNGKPVKREQEAIEDIEKHTNLKVKFVNYEDYEIDANE